MELRNCVIIQGPASEVRGVSQTKLDTKLGIRYARIDPEGNVYVTEEAMQDKIRKSVMALIKEALA